MDDFRGDGEQYGAILPFHLRGPVGQPKAAPPPHNLDAEQAFLGGLLYENELFFRVADWLKAEHFYDPVHQRIFDVAAGLIQRGSMADAVVLKTHFDRDDGLRDIGGTTYLAVLMEGAATSAAVVEYAKIVKELYLRREAIRIGRSLADRADSEGQDGQSDDVSVRELLAGVEQELYGLAELGSARRGFVSFKDALAGSLEMAAAAYERDGGLSGISTGLKALDDKLGGLHPTDLIIVAGRPSMGKTALATNIAFSVARAYQWAETAEGERKTIAGGRVGFFSLEMSHEQLATRLLADYTGIPGTRIRRGEIEAIEFETLRDAALEVASLPLYIDDQGGLPIAQLCARARRLKRTRGLDLIVVDYLQLVTASRTRAGDNRVQEVSEVTQALKALAKDLSVPVIALSQLSRKVEDRADKKPQLADLRESGSIEQDADVVCFVYREAYYKERERPQEDTPEYLAWEEEFRAVEHRAEVIVGKQRHGPIGTAELHFDGARTKFSDIETRRGG